MTIDAGRAWPPYMRVPKATAPEVKSLRELLPATDEFADAPDIVDTPDIGVVFDASNEDDVVRTALATLRERPASGQASDQASQAEARARVLEMFANADVTPELPPIINGIADLYDQGFDGAADHMEMSHWGLRHRLS